MENFQQATLTTPIQYRERKGNTIYLRELAIGTPITVTKEKGAWYFLTDKTKSIGPQLIADHEFELSQKEPPVPSPIVRSVKRGRELRRVKDDLELVAKANQFRAELQQQLRQQMGNHEIIMATADESMKEMQETMDLMMQLENDPEGFIRDRSQEDSFEVSREEVLSVLGKSPINWGYDEEVPDQIGVYETSER